MIRFKLSIKLLLLAAFAVSCSAVAAQNYLDLKLTTQNAKTILLSSINKITFSGGSMVFSYQDAQSDFFSISTVSKMTFDPNTQVDKVLLPAEITAIYPNPVKNIFFIKGISNPEAAVSIFSMNGTLVYRSTSLDVESGVDVSGLRSGLYLVKINNQTLKFSKL